MKKGELWQERGHEAVYKILSVSTTKRGPTFPPG